ncbi:BlaI/MecI/CopY family transcriptional regulator [Pontibacter cellulosilyticus]|uniref:BlaI/MecI/CopY family transcriptional regulator n=1 Tax=Pontibacter cellulosilyticus TaxID=1720253 RepID=A0A923N7I0_9BACT|nr:BlaI/MecI/CopY family transcriptional regulator [Pontibacter cellulosilyticus]MBC5991910.1 BlaI/MecI/CopY family transcriptional regulator [Pontibacter cellulosilyticus]
MQKLGKREEQIMQIVWKLERAFIKDIIDELPEPKPHYNTVATMVKILTEKGFLHAEKLGNIYQYTPVVTLGEYRKQDVAIIKKKYFGNSFSRMITHFAKEENLSDEELDELISIIKSQKTK